MVSQLIMILSIISINLWWLKEQPPYQTHSPGKPRNSVFLVKMAIYQTVNSFNGKPNKLTMHLTGHLAILEH